MTDNSYTQIEQIVQDSQRKIEEAFHPYKSVMQQVGEINLIPERAKRQFQQKIQLPNVIPGAKDVQQILEDTQKSIDSLSPPHSLPDLQSPIENLQRSIGFGHTAEIERHLLNSRRIQEDLRLTTKPIGFENCPLSVLPSFRRAFGL